MVQIHIQRYRTGYGAISSVSSFFLKGQLATKGTERDNHGLGEAEQRKDQRIERISAKVVDDLSIRSARSAHTVFQTSSSKADAEGSLKVSKCGVS